MIFEMFDVPFSALQLQQAAGFAFGILFGALALAIGFCLRSAVFGAHSGQSDTAKSVWVIAFACAVTGSLIAERSGWIAVEEHPLRSTSLSYLAVVLGGLLFGFGAVLTRGCVSRLTVLSGTGNLRAAIVLLVFAITAHAMMKGVLAPLRLGLSSWKLELPYASLADVRFGAEAIVISVLFFTLITTWHSRVKFVTGLCAALVGLLIPLAWITTSVLIVDEFEPYSPQAISFTLPWADTLFWSVASTAVPSGFGVQLVIGIIFGSFILAAFTGRLKLQGFDGTEQMLRYIAGGFCMGVGGVLAGGCSVGAGLSGAALFSFQAFLALFAIIVGMRVTTYLLGICTQKVRWSAAIH